MHPEISLSLSCYHSRTVGCFPLSLFEIRISLRKGKRTSVACACTLLRPLESSRSPSFRVNRREPSRDLRQCLSGHGLAPRSLRAQRSPSLCFTRPRRSFPLRRQTRSPLHRKNGFPHSAARRTSSAWRTSFPTPRGKHVSSYLLPIRCRVLGLLFIAHFRFTFLSFSLFVSDIRLNKQRVIVIQR